jgi:hypothetical protein
MSQHVQYENTSPASIDDLIKAENAQVHREYKFKIWGGIIIFLLLVLLFFMSPADEYIVYYRINKIEYTKDSLFITIGNKTIKNVRPKN